MNIVTARFKMVFNGTAPFALSYNNFIGAPQISTDNGAVGGTAMLLRGIGALKEDIKIFVGPEHQPATNISPPSRE